jgi:hypothetical protein
MTPGATIAVVNLAALAAVVAVGVVGWMVARRAVPTAWRWCWRTLMREEW